jgi:succinate-semialdehyde dehydrogenase / glutarate-semialdehyde dehydrogenase
MLTVIDPTTGKLLREVEAADAQQAQEAIARAQGAYDDWRRRSFDERAEILNAVAPGCARTSSTSRCS